MDRKNIVYQELTQRVDQDTGEVITEAKKKLIKVPRTPDFVMIFTKHIAFLEHLNKLETDILFELLNTYVGVGNILLLSPNVRKKIGKALDKNISSVHKAIKGLFDHGIIMDREDLTYLNPHLFGKGNWDDIYKMRQEVIYDFDFDKNEMLETRKVSTIYDKDFSSQDHKVIDQKEYIDNEGIPNQEITVEECEHPRQARLNFPGNTDELDMLKEQNKAKELSIKEMELKIKMRELDIS